MRNAKEDTSSSASQAIHCKPTMKFISTVKELQRLSSQELNKLLRESESFTVHCQAEDGPLIKVDMEKFVGLLPLHLMAVLVSVERDLELFRYFLGGLRLLHSLCELAPRHTKIEQILMDDVNLSEQLIDLVFYSLIVLSTYEQEVNDSGIMPLLHSVLVACSLHLLTGIISSRWQDLVHVLLAHPKIDMFMDVAFRAVCVVSTSLAIKLSDHHTGFCSPSDLSTEQILKYLCQQCEGSLEFLHSLCQHKTFRERLLRNRELCSRGGVLILARSILKLEVPPSVSGFSMVIAAISRLKSRVLSILLHLCEAESISYLDEVALCPGSLDIAKLVVTEVLNLLKSAVSKDYSNPSLNSNQSSPSGFLQLNAMRLADIFSDDSNFRSYITKNFTEVLTAIFSISHGDFLSCWCSSDPSVREEDATLEYDPYASAGWIMDVTVPSSHVVRRKLEFGLVPINLPRASYAHQRTSLFVKIIANLHCFIPDICEEEERNLFLHKFLEFLLGDAASGLSHQNGLDKASAVCKNLRSLLSHAESLIPTHLNEEDVQLLRVFSQQLHSCLHEQNGVKFQDRKYSVPACLDDFTKLKIDEHYQGVQSLVGCSNVPNGMDVKKEGQPGNSALQCDNFYVRNKRSGEEEGNTGDSGLGVSREPDKDVHIIETSGSDSSSVKGKNSIDQMENGDSSKLSRRGKGGRMGRILDDDKAEPAMGEEKQRKKRKRTIMNEDQISMIEGALVNEPEMQRNAVLIQSWADKLSSYGSEVTSSQLKNWLNNRKARLARAAKDSRAPPDVDNTAIDKSESPESPSIHETYVSSGSRSRPRSAASRSSNEKTETTYSRFELGQQVTLVDSHGEEVAKGKVAQVRGTWHGMSLDDMETYVVDITELKARRWLRLPHPSDATGNSFEEAEAKLGSMKVLWDSNKILNRPSK